MRVVRLSGYCAAAASLWFLGLAWVTENPRADFLFLVSLCLALALGLLEAFAWSMRRRSTRSVLDALVSLGHSKAFQALVGIALTIWIVVFVVRLIFSLGEWLESLPIDWISVGVAVLVAIAFVGKVAEGKERQVLKERREAARQAILRSGDPDLIARLQLQDAGYQGETERGNLNTAVAVAAGVVVGEAVSDAARTAKIEDFLNDL